MKILSILILAILLCAASIAWGQTETPDTPSTVQVTTCTENNGSPCPEWVHKLIGQYPPVQRPPVERDTLPWKHVFDWKFAAAHGVYLGAMLYDQQVTLNGEAKGCALESGDHGAYYASRGDLMKKNMPFFVGITVADALLRKVGVKRAWATAPFVAAGKHAYGAYQWAQACR